MDETETHERVLTHKDEGYVVSQFEDVPETCKVIVTVRDVETGEKIVSYGYVRDSVADISTIHKNVCMFIEKRFEETKMYKVK